MSAYGRVVDFVLAHQLMLVGASLLLFVASLFVAATRLRVEPGVDQMIGEGSGGTSRTARELRHIEDTDEIAILAEGDVFSPGFLARLERLSRALGAALGPSGSSGSGMAEPGATNANARGRLRDLASLLTIKRLVGHDLTLERQDFSLLARDDPARLRSVALSSPLVVDRLVDREGRATLIVLKVAQLDDAQARSVHAAVETVLKRHSKVDFRLSQAGWPVLRASLTKLLYRDTGVLFVFSMLGVFGVMLWSFRRPRALLGAALVVPQTVAFTLAFMALCEQPLTVIGLYVPAFLAVVAVSDAVHLQARYARAKLPGVSPRAALRAAFVAAGPPVLHTSITTALGLLSLRLSDLQAVRDLGTAAAVGVMAALVFSLITVPAVLVSEQRGAVPPAPVTVRWWGRAVMAAERLSRPRPGRSAAVLWAVLVALGLSAWGMGRLRLHHEMIGWLPESNPLAGTVAKIDRRLGGTASMTLYVTAPTEDGMRTVEGLQRLAAALSYLERYPDPLSERPFLRASLGVVDVVRSFAEALAVPRGKDGLPVGPEALAGVWSAITLMGDEDLDDYVSAEDARTARVELRVPWREAGAYEPWLAHVRAGMHAELGDDYRFSVVGPVVAMNRSVNSLLSSLIRSFCVAFLAVSLAMVLFVRNARLGLLAMVPNLLPVVLVLGLMGLLGIPADVNTLMLATILLGIVVDDTIHLLHHFRMHLAHTGDAQASASMAVVEAGGAMLVTSASLAVGFLAMLAATLNHLRQFALLAACAIVVALAVDLLITPMLLRRTGRWVAALDAPPREGRAPERAVR